MEFEELVNKFESSITRREKIDEDSEILIFRSDSESSGFVDKLSKSNSSASVLTHKGPFLKINYSDKSRKFDGLPLKKGDILFLEKEGKCRIIDIRKPEDADGKIIKLQTISTGLPSVKKGEELFDDLSKRSDFHFHLMNGLPGELYWWTAGFIYSYGTITLRTTPSTYDYETSLYKSITGATDDVVGCLLDEQSITYNPNNKTWGTNASVSFIEPPKEILDRLVFPENKKGKILSEVKNSVVFVYNRSYVWSLIKYGFRAGSNHNIEEIMDNLSCFESDNYRLEFSEGSEVKF